MTYQILGKDKPYIGREDDFQQAVARYIAFAYPSLLWFHVPNGGQRNAKEGAKFKRMGVRPGVADIIILQQGTGYIGLIIELKVKGGTVQMSQKKFLNTASENGYLCVVCYNLDSVAETLKRYLK